MMPRGEGGRAPEASDKLLMIRHGDDPPDDRAHSFAVLNGLEPKIVKPFAGETIPDPAGFRGVVLYGGKYSVYDVDEHPFLLDEYRLIDACLSGGIPLLGICQGAQQIAWRLGADVGPRPDGWHEFGYYPLKPTSAGADYFDGPLVVAESHYHGFALPDGAVALAGTDAYPNQAVRFRERVYGLQFHPEVTIEGFRRWQDAPWAMFGKPGAQDRDEQDRLMLAHDAAQARWFYRFLDRLFGTAPARS